MSHHITACSIRSPFAVHRGNCQAHRPTPHQARQVSSASACSDNSHGPLERMIWIILDRRILGPHSRHGSSTNPPTALAKSDPATVLDLFGDLVFQI